MTRSAQSKPDSLDLLVINDHVVVDGSAPAGGVTNVRVRHPSARLVALPSSAPSDPSSSLGLARYSNPTVLEKASTPCGRSQTSPVSSSFRRSTPLRS
jgi:hypothetical protein